MPTQDYGQNRMGVRRSQGINTGRFNTANVEVLGAQTYLRFTAVSHLLQTLISYATALFLVSTNR